MFGMYKVRSGNNKFLYTIKNILFPIQCVGCFVFDTILCETCFEKIEYRKFQVCPFCLEKSSYGKTCERCNKNNSLDGLYQLCTYSPMLQTIIHQYKYNGVLDCESIINKIILKNTPDNHYFSQFTSIAMIPLHKRKQYERGFNQVESITEFLSKQFNLYEIKELSRISYTDSQAQLSREERQQNVKKSFVYSGKNLSSENILLIDDIYTTGNTMQEVARVLKQHGAKNVSGLVLARNID